MDHTSADALAASLKPLFRRRRRYFLLAISAFLLLAATYNSWFIIVTAFLFLLSIILWVKAASQLEARVWQTFSEQLDPVDSRAVDPASPLKGVMGSVGQERTFYPLARGTYRGYPIRLLKQTTVYNPGSKRRSYAVSHRILEITTKQNFYHVFVDSKGNDSIFVSSSLSTLSRSLRSNQTLSVEGDVDKFFTIYVPTADDYKSLVTLTPEKLLALRDYGTKFDIEFVGNTIYIISDSRVKNITDVLVYQESILALLKNIGVDVVRARDDVDDTLIVKNPFI